MLDFFAAINEYPWTTLFLGIGLLILIKEWRQS